MNISIRPIASDSEARAAAQIMASTDPWLTLGRTFEHTYRAVSNTHFERHVALADDKVIAVMLLASEIPLARGYIAALAVAEGHRNGGIGAEMLRFAEDRIFKVSPNVFLCVTSFNVHAQRFYTRHGYEQVGLLKDYDVPGIDELLMRKTKGPWSTFTPI
jgi:ribosomal-protein-alanine N-acetyltransferase